MSNRGYYVVLWSLRRFVKNCFVYVDELSVKMNHFVCEREVGIVEGVRSPIRNIPLERVGEIKYIIFL